MIDARENYNDFNSLEMISASSMADVNAQMNKSAIDDIPPPDTPSLFFQRDPIPFKTQSAINHTMLQFINNDASGLFSNSTFSACTFQVTHSHTYMLQQRRCSKSRFVRSTHLLTLIFTVKPAIVPTSIPREPPYMYITHSQVSPMDFTI